MVITKGEKTYIVKENKAYWSVECNLSGVEVSFKVPKDMCATLENAAEYVKNSDIF